MLGRIASLSILAGALNLWTGALPCLAQTAIGNEDPPRFEVASVHPGSSAIRHEINGLYTYPGGRVACNGCTLQYLVMEAFHLDEYQISGGPDWLKSERFDIKAKPPETSPVSKLNPAIPRLPPPEEERLMLQSLLIDRFHLKFHRESKNGLVFLLFKSDRPLKIQPPKQPNEYPWAGGIGGSYPDGAGLRGINISMPQLAVRLGGWLHHPVIDQTGLQGSFDFEFQSGDEDAPTSDDIVSSIVTSLNHLGFRLTRSTGPVQALVIESAEKPGEN